MTDTLLGQGVTSLVPIPPKLLDTPQPVGKPRFLISSEYTRTHGWVIEREDESFTYEETTVLRVNTETIAHTIIKLRLAFGDRTDDQPTDEDIENMIEYLPDEEFKDAFRDITRGIIHLWGAIPDSSAQHAVRHWLTNAKQWSDPQLSDTLTEQNSALEQSHVSIIAPAAERDLHDKYIESAKRVDIELKNPAWDFRSPLSIAKATGLPQSFVKKYLEQSPGVTKYDFPNHTRKPVYAPNDVGWLQKIKRHSNIIYARLSGHLP